MSHNNEHLPVTSIELLTDDTIKAAIDRLKSYKPPPTNYDLVPLTRRAAVLLLLYADAKGDLRVVLTIRAKTLSSCMLYLVGWRVYVG